MGALGNFTNALLDSVNTATKTYDKYITDQATLSTQTKNIQLHNDITAQINKIRMSSPSDYENWNTDINTFFEEVKNGMSNKDSPYYCQNNLQAEMFTKILEQNQASVNDQVTSMVNEQRVQKNRIDVNKALLGLQEAGLSGQAYYDEAKKVIDSAYAVGTYSQAEYEQLMDNNFYVGYSAMYDNMFDNTVYEAIDRGDSWEKIKTMMQEQAPAMMKTDGDNMPAAFDKQGFDKKVFDGLEKRYRAIQQDVWNETEKTFADYYDRMLDQRTVEGRNNVKQQARYYIDSIKKTGKASADQITKWTAKFVLEDYLDGGTTTRGQASSAAKKMNPKDFIEFTMNAIERGAASDLGGLDSVYDAWTFFKDEVLAEYQSYEGNENADWVELEKAYPIVGQFFDYAEKNLPPEFQDVIASAENCLKQILNTEDNKELYKEEYSSTMDLVKDILFETKKSATDNVSKEALKTRVLRAINANLGGILEKNKNYKQYLGEDYTGIKNLSNYKNGVIVGKEKRMAQAMQERDAHPDLVYTDKHGDQKEYALSEGLSRLENDEKSELKKILGVDDGDISMNYDNDGTHDILPRRIYTIDGYDYRFTSSDGKTIKLEKKKNGETPNGKPYKWEEAKTEKQQKKYDLDTGLKTWDKSDQTTKPPIKVSNPSAAGGGEMTADQWASMGKAFKRNIIKNWIKEDPEAATKWINSLKSK